MDIRQWLEDTADREPPNHSDDINIPDRFRNHRPEPDQVGRGYRYKRKRTSSDSSIIAPKQLDRRHAQTPTRASSPDHSPQAEDTARRPQGKSRSRASGSSHHNAPVKTYERRARRKTRPDRYEPKARKQKGARDSRKEKKSGQKRRRSRRIDDGGRTTGLVQSFQLKNGPKNNRLTLKPDTSAGLFKHGRASVQMAGRGGGLPDLTFNEMRFLQKPTEHQDDVHGAGESHKSRTKGQRLDQGEEISAYFNEKTATATKRSEARNDRRKRSERDNERLTHSRRSKEANCSKSLVELPDRPFLGFGSKGAHQLSNDTNSDSTSYYTWSETRQRPSSPPLKRPNETHINEAEPDRRWREHHVMGRSRGDDATAHSRAAVAQPVQNSNKDIGHGAWIRTGRGSGPALVEVYQPPNPRKPKRRDNTPVIQTTSQSLPRHPSSPPQFHAGRTNDTVAVAAAREQRSYHTSDILKIHAAPLEATYTSPRPHFHTPHMDQEKENRDPESSLSIDKAIRQARAAVLIPSSIPEPATQVQKLAVVRLPNIRRMPSINDLPKIRQADPSLQMRNSGFMSLQPSHYRPFQAQSHSPLHYRPLSAAESRRWDTTAMDALASRTPDMSQVQEPSYVDEDEEMLDNAADGEPANVFNNNAYMDNRYANAIPYDRHFSPRSGIFEAPINIRDRHPSVSVFSEQKIVRAGPIRGLSIENELRSERSVGHAADHIDEGLARFWKPNILY